MQQFTIVSAAPQASGVAPGQAATFPVGEGGGEGLDNLAGLNFGAILGKQIKGLAVALDLPGDGKVDASTENPEVAALLGDLQAPSPLPADLAVLAAPVQAGVAQRTVESEIDALSGRGEAAKPLLILPEIGKESQPAEIAGKGTFLPQASGAGKPFSEELLALAEAAACKPEALPETDVQAVSAPSVAHGQVAAVKQMETVLVQTVLPRVGSAEWGGVVGEKVVWMASQNNQMAELHLNPPSLGPLEVRLSISNDQATALFVSNHSAVREAIETALPRLREMLADNGIMLGNAMVSAESFGGQQGFERGEGKRHGEGGPDAEVLTDLHGMQPGRVGLMREGMVDIFA